MNEYKTLDIVSLCYGHDFLHNPPSIVDQNSIKKNDAIFETRRIIRTLCDVLFKNKTSI